MAYLYTHQHLRTQHYYGEIDYEYIFHNHYSGCFKWLYVDQQTISSPALKAVFKMQVLHHDEHWQ